MLCTGARELVLNHRMTTRVMGGGLENVQRQVDLLINLAGFCIKHRLFGFNDTDNEVAEEQNHHWYDAFYLQVAVLVNIKEVVYV